MTDDLRVRTDVFGMTHVGRVREANEDHFVVASLRKTLTLRHTNVDRALLLERDAGPEALLMLVADGVGGHAGGADASREAATAIVEYLSSAAHCFNNLDVDHEHEFMERLEGSVRIAHDRITAAAAGHHPPATTLTMVLLVAPRAYVVHVGDSRAMFVRKGRLRVLTRDQTMGEELLDVGAITQEQAQRSRFRDQLTSALGSSAMTPTLGLVDLRAGDVLLLCTDGLTKHVTDERITEVLSDPGTVEQVTARLMEDALVGGGTDNISIVVARLVARDD